MSHPRNVLIVGEDAVLTGEIKSPGRVEVYGRLEGDVTSDEIVVHKDAELKGTVRARGAKVSGALNGEARIKELISIASTGAVSGRLLYGRLAMEDGAELSANVRNVPPTLAGDFEMSVRKGRSVRVTSDDLKANDVDDTPDRLTFTVQDARDGFIANAQAPDRAITSFTQADINAGRVLFTHNGSGAARAAFSVTVADGAGATAGAAREIAIAVIT